MSTLATTAVAILFVQAVPGLLALVLVLFT